MHTYVRIYIGLRQCQSQRRAPPARRQACSEWNALRTASIGRRYGQDDAAILAQNTVNSVKNIISASLTINIIQRKRSWDRPVAFPMCRSVTVEVIAALHFQAPRLIRDIAPPVTGS